MEKIINSKHEKSTFHVLIEETFPRLQQLKKEKNRIAFDSLMEKVLPTVKQYINRQLKASIKNKTLPEGKYKVEDFTDELYIEAYENIQDFTEKKQLRLWLFSHADIILEDTIIEEEFDSLFFKNIDDFSKEEWDAMEEQFTKDGDGDLIMLEELDDLSYSKQDYTLADVFIEDNEENLIENLNAEMTKKEIQQQVESILFLLPFHIRTIFELSVNLEFDSEEVADIKNMTARDVEEILAKAKNIIRSSLLKHKRRK